MITRRITFRLYPTKSVDKTMHYWRRLHKDLYNACIYHRKVEYKHCGRNISYYDQQKSLVGFKECFPEYKDLGSHALQNTLKRVDIAFNRFFRGLGGYPKFKGARYYRGWTYPCKSGWKALSDGKNGKLKISNLGIISMRGEARTWGKPTTCTIIWSQGKWYASITVKCEPTRETGKRAVGVDFGCVSAASFSDGTKIDNPRFLATAMTQIRQLSKQLRRKKKRSSRWKKTQRQIAKLKRQVANRRQDWIHKVAAEIVSDNSLVATEKLNVKNMTASAKTINGRKQKAGLNRSILDVGFGGLHSAIKYKLEEAGGLFIEVPTKKVKPSQTCPSCGVQKKKGLDERVHQCPCGCVIDRDVAAAQVMLNYARGLGTSLLDDDGLALLQTPVYTGGFKQLSQMKRHKPYP